MHLLPSCRGVFDRQDSLRSDYMSDREPRYGIVQQASIDSTDSRLCYLTSSEVSGTHSAALSSHFKIKFAVRNHPKVSHAVWRCDLTFTCFTTKHFTISHTHTIVSCKQSYGTLACAKSKPYSVKTQMNFAFANVGWNYLSPSVSSRYIPTNHFHFTTLEQSNAISSPIESQFYLSQLTHLPPVPGSNQACIHSRAYLSSTFAPLNLVRLASMYWERCACSPSRNIPPENIDGPIAPFTTFPGPLKGRRRSFDSAFGGKLHSQNGEEFVASRFAHRFHTRGVPCMINLETFAANSHMCCK